MMKFLDYEGLQKFKECADAAYLPAKGTIPLTGSINLTTESVASLGIKYAKVANNSLNFYVIADSSGKLPSSETRININSSITSLVGAEGANVGDIFVVGKLDLKPVYKVIPLNDAKAANGSYAGTNGIMTPWDKARVNKVDGIEGTANNALNRANNALNNLPTLTETNMNNALATGVYPWCTLGRPDGSTGAYTCITIHTTTKDGNGFDTIEQTAYGRQGELGKVYKRAIFKSNSETQFGDWIKISHEASTTKKKITIHTTTKDGNGFDTIEQTAYGRQGELGKVYKRAIFKSNSETQFGDWIKISHEASTTKEKNTKTQYVIGKAIPIGKLNGGARLNAYVVTSNIFRFKLSNVPQITEILNNGDDNYLDYEKVDNALINTTWHLFINDIEVYLYERSTTCNGRVLQLLISPQDFPGVGCYQLDESKSSVDLSSDMYIYLRKVRYFSSHEFTFKGTSKTLYYDKGRRIWEPTILNPYISPGGIFETGHSGCIQLQKLYTRQRRSKRSGIKISFPTRMYRGTYSALNIRHYGTYRYRLVSVGKKTQWRTIIIMRTNNNFLIK